MRTSFVFLFITLLILGWMAGCVDPYDPDFRTTLNVVVVDGTITSLAEPQRIRLNRSLTDPLTNIPRSEPITKATVEVIVDSARVVVAHETENGTYQLPSDFRGQIGHAYQLRFTLPDGTRYESTQQVMPAVPPIDRVTAQFNTASLPATRAGAFRAGHDLFLDTQDPADQVNYYRWDWKLWEKQDWCRTCIQGAYSINNVITNTSPNGSSSFSTGDSLFENCFYPPPRTRFEPVRPYFVYDYRCRTQCWAILSGYDLNVFADIYANGRPLARRKVAQIPFYQRNPCLVEIRQAALTPSAFRFYKQLQDQTQNTGGVADTPPSASVGNVQNIASRREIVVGVFTASAVATVRYWLNRKDTQGEPLGLFYGQMGRQPIEEPEPPTPPLVQILNSANVFRPYTAVCLPGDGQTPVKPIGWQE